MEADVLWDRLHEICKQGVPETALAQADVPNEVKGLLKLAVTKDRTKLLDIARYISEFEAENDYALISAKNFIDRIKTVVERPD